jgi:hypothetical protein
VRSDTRRYGAQWHSGDVHQSLVPGASKESVQYEFEHGLMVSREHASVHPPHGGATRSARLPYSPISIHPDDVTLDEPPYTGKPST